MTRKQRIEQQIQDRLSPAHLQVEDESSGHNVPKGSESHFNLMVVSDAFAGELRVQRHRRIYEILEGELAGGLHALTLTLLTPDEFAAKGGGRLDSPPCHGGSKSG